MTNLQLAAYGTLCDTANKLNALISNARSSSHPLDLKESTVDAITTAMNALHRAQRSME